MFFAILKKILPKAVSADDNNIIITPATMTVIDTAFITLFFSSFFISLELIKILF